MIESLKLYLDPYGRRARLAPGIYMLLPVAVLIGALGFRNLAPISITAAVLGMAGGPALLADLVREQGLKQQARLYKLWGGAPSTNYLRLRVTSDNAVRRDKWRSAIANLSGGQLSNARSESQSPLLADQRIVSAVDTSRDKLRDYEKYNLLFHELCIYGFRRNALSMRTWAVCVVLASAAIALLGWFVAGLISNRVAIAMLAIDSVASTFWIAIVKDSWVESAAKRYAFQLLQAAVREVG